MTFDDATCQMDRHRFFNDLLELGADARWTYLRTAPKPEVTEVTEALEERGVHSRVKALPDQIPGSTPALHPVAR